MISVAVFLLSLGATARITRFIIRDYLFRHPRAWIIRRLGPDNDIAYAMTCTWCLSVWVGCGVFALAWFYGDTAAFQILSAGLTASFLIAAAAPLFDPVPADEHPADDEAREAARQE